MLTYLTLLLSLQLAGEIIVAWTGLPLPGPVVGMALLFIGLTVRGGLPEGLERTAQGLLQHLSLLFVPAGVGVVLHLSLVRAEWLPITAAVIGSTLLTIIVTALVMALMIRLTDRAAEGKRQ